MGVWGEGWKDYRETVGEAAVRLSVTQTNEEVCLGNSCCSYSSAQINELWVSLGWLKA
jgi:hypothetical protein